MTTALAYRTSKVPKIEVTRIVAPPIEFVMACTPQFIDFGAPSDVYTDAQFFADLKKSSKRRRQMIAEALEEDAKGETLEFPT